MGAPGDDPTCDRCADPGLCRIFGGCQAETERQRAEDEKRRMAEGRAHRLAKRRRAKAGRKPFHPSGRG